MSHKSASVSRRKVLLAVLFALLLSLGCRSAKVVKLDADDNGSLAELKVGQALAISLESNPSTGFRWEVNDLDEGKLQQVGEAEFEARSDLVGASGVETFRFKAAGVGETTLKLVYRRAWEDKPPLETFSCKVVVR